MKIGRKVLAEQIADAVVSAISKDGRATKADIAHAAEAAILAYEPAPICIDYARDPRYLPRAPREGPVPESMKGDVLRRGWPVGSSRIDFVAATDYVHDTLLTVLEALQQRAYDPAVGSLLDRVRDAIAVYEAQRWPFGK